MKKIYLLRHAHSSPAEPMGNDHTRPLSYQGQQQAAAVRDFMTREAIAPQLVLSSDSVRTIETATLIGSLSHKAASHLYLADAEILLDEIHAAPDDIDSIMIIAHNPGLAEIAMALGGEDAAVFPPATMGVFAADVDDWAQVSPDNTRLEKIFMP